MKKQTLKISVAASLALALVLGISSFKAGASVVAKDGIKSTATSNCWGDGSDCKKGAE